MTDAERDHFDQLFERVLRELPQRIRDYFEEAPLILEDHPTPAILAEFGMEPDDSGDILCGLYTGTPLIERSVDHGSSIPDHIYLFRSGIIGQAGGWIERIDDDGEPFGGEDAIAHEIRVTILHELGHHFGLDEDDLSEMGYD